MKWTKFSTSSWFYFHFWGWNCYFFLLNIFNLVTLWIRLQIKAVNLALTQHFWTLNVKWKKGGEKQLLVSHRQSICWQNYIFKTTSSKSLAFEKLISGKQALMQDEEYTWVIYGCFHSLIFLLQLSCCLVLLLSHVNSRHHRQWNIVFPLSLWLPPSFHFLRLTRERLGFNRKLYGIWYMWKRPYLFQSQCNISLWEETVLTSACTNQLTIWSFKG